jgi:hypothetical protein
MVFALLSIMPGFNDWFAGAITSPDAEPKGEQYPQQILLNDDPGIVPIEHFKHHRNPISQF